ncbi:MAG: HAMP domain-containing histidine kinase [Solobacterium sp.]|nr:HAMP domain-containing histidine kinase [Solobacterium sp.]MBR2768940.1 HAMP domain-containing histidine kinase [Solobacterium sp.]
MKLDFRGIRFSMWLFFMGFAILVVLVLGVLQFSLVKPYYRNNKLQTVKEVSNEIQRYVIEDNQNSASIHRAFQVAVDNNVCVAVYNSRGVMVYSADSLGSGCVFNANARTDSSLNTSDGRQMKNLLDESSGECSLNIINERTGQDMVVYGRKIPMELVNFYLYVNSPLEPVDSIVSFFGQQYIFYTIIVILAASLISLYLSSRLTRPIVEMNREADRLADADYSVSFSGGSFTETKELAHALNDATDKLAKIDELRKDLIANVSHDIKTPLTSIRAYAEMIRDISGDNPAKRDEHLDVIISEADYLDKLVVDMSELSKLQSGTYVLKESNFDLSSVIRKVVRLFTVMIDERNLNVVMEIPESLTVYGDETKITEVIYNFLSNAVKHSPDGKTITIRAFLKEDEETVRVEVQDEGEGIPEAELPLIWDRYQKSSRSFSRSMSSTGLGLSIVKAILDSHHAKYGVVTSSEKGSLFWFEICSPKEVKE